MGRTRPARLYLLVALTVAAGGGLLGAAPALGDDASLDAAYTKAATVKDRAEATEVKALKDPSTTIRLATKLLRAVDRAVVAAARAVQHEHASTPTGRKARTTLLHGLNLGHAALQDGLRGAAAAAHGNRSTAKRLFRRSERRARAADSEIKRGEKLLRATRKLPPDTKITTGPSGTTSGPIPVFEFSATTSRSTFQCQFDGAPLAPCTSPFTSATPLDPGAHTFTVVATDPAGHTDPTPAAAAFTVAAIP